MTANQIRQRIDAILDFLTPFWELVNCHMVNYLTDNHWKCLIPEEIQKEISSSPFSIDECIEKVFWKGIHSNDFPQISKFMERSKGNRLENFPEIITPLQHLYETLDAKQTSCLSIKEFMSEKKRHEVETTAELIDKLIKHQQLSDNEKIFFVIDAGDGKGYLSSRLALEFKHPVLGIDLNATNSENALQRNKKLQRAWNGLTERAVLENKGIIPSRRGKKQQQQQQQQQSLVAKNDENYKTKNHFITTNVDFYQLLRLSFPIVSDFLPPLCLTGLHTCGNLSATCLKIFTKQTEFKILCNIGCCYHQLKEEFTGKEFFANTEILEMQNEPGFPLSQYLRNLNMKMGRNARMLAAQSIHRTISTRELPNISLFYRALLEILLVSENPKLKNLIQVGKIRKFTNFMEYIEQCCKKTDISLPANGLNITEWEEKYSNDVKFLNLFYLIRMTFAPVLESVILLDRLLFLKENSIENSFLVPLFDPVISPRCYCIVSLR